MVYEWRKGSRIKGDADKIGNEISEIGKEITAIDIEKKARDKKTELHNCFEWYETKAAYQFRLSQARDIIGSLVIVMERQDEKSGEVIEMHIRQWENVRIGGQSNKLGETRQVYVPITNALKNPDLKMQVFGRLDEMLKEAETIAENYEYLSGKLKSSKGKIKEAREIINAD